MMRPPLTCLGLPLLIGVVAASLLLVCGASVASGQAKNTAAVATPDTEDALICGEHSRVLSRVTVGRKQRRTFVLDIARNSCGSAGTFGDWDLMIYRPDLQGGGVLGNLGDDVQQENCPALSAYMRRLPAPRLTNRHWWAQPVTGVTVGPFFIENPAGIFRLRSEHDRQATAKWLRRMLAAVRRCWNNHETTDRGHPLADRFYATMRF